jgi:hypothetical protein
MTTLSKVRASENEWEIWESNINGDELLQSFKTEKDADRYLENGGGKVLKRFRVYYIDEVVAETEEDAYEKTLEYLRDCVNYGDVSLFNYEFIGNAEEITNA